MGWAKQGSFTHGTSGGRQAELLLCPILSQCPGECGPRCEEGATQRSAVSLLQETLADKPNWPAPFGTAVRPKSGASKEPAGERITYSLRARGRWEGEASVTTNEVRAASASG